MGFNRLQLGTAFGILLKTTPILLIRLGVYLAFWVILLVYLGIVIGLGYLLSMVWQPLGVILGLIAFGSTFFIYRLAYRYVFYLLKAAHLAIAAELLHSGALPAGVGQLAWGREQVSSRFGQVSVMFVVDELVTAIVRTVTNTVVSVANMLPGDAIRNLARLIKRIIEYATNYVDEAILARAFWRRDENVWQSAEEGIVLYAMVWKPLVLNAVALMLLSYVPFVLAAVILAAPVGLLLGMINTTLAGWSVLFVLILSYFVKVAVGDSFAMIAMVAAYQRETAGLRPDPAMEARISGMSEKFSELKDRAAAASPFGNNAPRPKPTATPGEFEAGRVPQNTPRTQMPPQPQSGRGGFPPAQNRPSQNPAGGSSLQGSPSAPRPGETPPQQRSPQQRPAQRRPANDDGSL